MTVKELIVQLSEFDTELKVCYLNEEDGCEDEVVEIVKQKDYLGVEVVVLAREGAFG